MHSSLEPLIRKWRTADIGVLPPYGEAIIRSTFLEAGIEPSKDLITLYSAIGGMESDDRDLWRLWSLSEIDGRKAEKMSLACCSLTTCWNLGSTV